MASHVTFTPSAGVTATKAITAQAGAGADTTAAGGLMGVFAALLGAASQATAATASAEATVDPALGNLVNLSFGAGFDGEESEPAEDPEAVAAVVDATIPIPLPFDSKPVLAELVDSLAALKQSLAAGDSVDPQLLERIDATLTNLATEFDIDLSALPTLDDLKALATTIIPDDTSVSAQLTAALAPLAETLLSGSATTEAPADVDAALKAIGEKLAALLQKLNSEGLDADAGTDADLEAAIARLVSPPVKVDASANAQVFATPQLKLTEPVLTGKPPADTGAAAEPAAPVKTADAGQPIAVAPSNQTDTDDTGERRDSDSDDRKPAEAKTAPVSVAAAAEAGLPDPQASTQTTHQASRIDAAAARPVVQTGYQTSQQQLNLPQLAFELVRQVNDGNTRFQMRLDPPELGKIDVKLDIDATGQVNARLTVERAETLDLMQRDQRGLERALQQAGLDSAKTNLEFSLRQNPFSGGNQQGQGGQGRQPLFGGNAGAEAEDTPPPTVNLYRGSLTASGVNIIA